MNIGKCRAGESTCRMPYERSALGLSRVALTTLLCLYAAKALAAPSAPPCTPSGAVGVEARPTAYVVDYHFTAASSSDWGDPDNWSYGSWADAAAANALVPASRPFTCLNGSGDTVGPFTAYPRVIIDAGKFAQIDQTPDLIGELVIETGATLFPIISLTEFLTDFGNADIAKTLDLDGLLVIGQSLSLPLPGATIGSTGTLRLGQFSTLTADAGAVFQGNGEIQLLGATIEFVDDVTFDVDLIAKEEKNQITALPLAGLQVVTITDYAQVKALATLELGIAADLVEINDLFEVNGQLVLRATETVVLADFGTLAAASPAGRITTEQDATNPVISLTNRENLFVQSGARLEITGTLGGFDPSNVSFTNDVGGILVIQAGGIVTTRKPPVSDVSYIMNFGRIDLAGEIHGTLRNAGTIYPGSSPGVGTILGDLQLLPLSTIVSEIDGTQAGIEYDQLIVGGTAELDGTLTVDIGPGFSPAPEDGFLILEASTRTGTFAEMNGAGVLPITYDPDRVYLGANPDEFDTSTWPRPIVGAEIRPAETSFCVDDQGFHFDIIFGMADTYDLMILALATDTPSSFSNPSESIRLNYYTVEEIFDPRLADPIVKTTSGYAGLDRLLDGLVPNPEIGNLRNGFFRFRGTVADGTEPFSGGDLIGSLALRAGQHPPNPDPGTSYDTRTVIYTSGSSPDLLRVDERSLCTLPEPNSTALSAAALGVLGVLQRRARRQRSDRRR